MSVRAVVAVGVAVLLACVGVVLADAAPRRAGTNTITDVATVAQLRAGQRHCQNGETVPKDAASLRVLVATFGEPIPSLAVTVRDAEGRVVTGGHRVAGGREGLVAIPVRQVSRTTPNTEVCLTRGAGHARRLVLYGEAPRIRLEWLRPGNESWYALLPTVAHRFSFGKASLFGPLWLLVAAALVVLAALVAVRVLVRETEVRP
jgi:hypothetical protein